MDRTLSWIQDNQKALIIAGICFISFVLFEARQQLYYAENFNNGTPLAITFWDVLLGGIYRWLFWLLISIPVILILIRVRANEMSGRVMLISIGLVLISSLIVLIWMSLMNIWFSDLRWSAFGENLEFYFYHKAPILLVASTFLVIMVVFFLDREALEVRIQELGSLKNSDEQLYHNEGQNLNDKEMVVQAKVGQRVKLIPISTITWIEADDYCVKIHDKSGQSVTMRTSLKAFEAKLPKGSFGRVHRKAIVNYDSIKELDMTTSPEAILMDGTRVPVAQARVKSFRQTFMAV